MVPVLKTDLGVLISDCDVEHSEPSRCRGWRKRTPLREHGVWGWGPPAASLEGPVRFHPVLTETPQTSGFGERLTPNCLTIHRLQCL